MRRPPYTVADPLSRKPSQIFESVDNDVPLTAKNRSRMLFCLSPFCFVEVTDKDLWEAQWKHAGDLRQTLVEIRGPRCADRVRRLAGHGRPGALAGPPTRVGATAGLSCYRDQK